MNRCKALVGIFSFALILNQATLGDTVGQSPPLMFYIVGQSTTFTGPGVVIPYDTSQVRFVIHPRPGIVSYRLKGYDDFHQRGGQMYIGIRFYQKNGDFLDEITFLKDGQSPGWQDSLENSTFTFREEKIQIPKNTDKVELFFSSAGPPSSVGIIAVADFDLYQNNIPLHLSTEWKKGGGKPSMAFAKEINGHHSLVIDDDDIKTHADWTASRKAIGPAGDFILRWKEIYSNGMGDSLTTSYYRLPIGHYQFEVREIDLAGHSTGSYSMKVLVPAPFWKTWWFWSLCFIVTIAIGITGGILWARANNRRREKEIRLIEEERRRIARDLHDELGARISQISLASSYAEGLTNDEKPGNQFRTITGLAQELSISLTETIWMLNSKNDHLESLVEYLCRLVSSLCRPSGISCRIQADIFEGHLVLSGDFRRHVSLSVREAVTNALKHSGAGELRFLLKISDSRLMIQIIDNGMGIPKNISGGNGLANMRQRMTDLQGQFLIKTPETGGTRIIFELPLPTP
jgi:two-component sensor histidine kinase